MVGSITHCAGYRGAAVGRCRDLLTIGLDAEPDQPLPDEVLTLISLPGERARLRGLMAEAPGTCWDRLLFSAKESVYKAWFPLALRWLGFADADIATFEGSAARGGSGDRRLAAHRFQRPLASRDGLIVTAITVPA